MHKPRSLAQNLIPTLATVCLLGSQARAFIPRRIAAAQSGHEGAGLNQSWSPQASNAASLISVPFAKLPSFVRRLGTPLESTALTLSRMKSLATQSAQNTANSAQRTRLDTLYQANLNVIRSISAAAHYESTLLLDGSSDALLLGPEGSGRMLTLDLPDLSDTGIFPFGSSLIRSQRMALDALPKLNAALDLSMQTQVDVNQAVHTLSAPLNAQGGSKFRGGPDLEVPSIFISKFVRQTTIGLGQSGLILVAMQALAQHNAANGTTQSERDERAMEFEDLQIELEKFAYNFSIGDFVLFNGLGEAILKGSGRLNAEVEYDLPDLRTSGLFSSDPAIDTQAQAQQTVVNMNYALFQIHEARYDLQLAAHLAAL